MIYLHKLTESDKNRKVVYKDNCGGKPEEGVLSSWNDTFVFVRFRGPNGEACSPHNVNFIDD